MKKLIATTVAAVAALLGVHAVATSQDQATCTTVMDCAQKAMEAAFQSKTAIRIAVPKGAIMAFNLDECPEGWTPFEPLAGRVAIGAGSGGGLSPRKRGETGGTETHTLTVDEIPSHSHNYTFSNGESSPDSTDYTPHEFGAKNIEATSSATGGGTAHNNMQPYAVLLYCQRS